MCTPEQAYELYLVEWYSGWRHVSDIGLTVGTVKHTDNALSNDWICKTQVCIKMIAFHEHSSIAVELRLLLFYLQRHTILPSLGLPRALYVHIFL